MPNWTKNKNDNLVEIDTIDFEYEYVLTAVGNPLTTKTPKVRTLSNSFANSVVTLT